MAWPACGEPKKGTEFHSCGRLLPTLGLLRRNRGHWCHLSSGTGLSWDRNDFQHLLSCSSIYCRGQRHHTKRPAKTGKGKTNLGNITQPRKGPDELIQTFDFLRVVVKVYLGQEVWYCTGSSISDSSWLLQSGSGENQYGFGGKGEFNTMKHSFYKGFLWVIRVWCHH